jgi:Tfp pilus assembly protein PilF
LAEAVASCRKAIELKPDYADAHCNLGNALHYQLKLTEAVACFRKAIKLKPDDAEVHYNLGNALRDQGELTEAVASYRKAIELEPAYAEAHNKLGYLLSHKGQLDESITHFRKAIELEPAHAVAHCNLGHVLRQEGRYADALTELKRGHELGSKQPGWNYPSADWVSQAKALVELDAKLPKILSGEAMPADTPERIALAELCVQFKKLYVTSFRFYFEAFAEKPELADDLEHGHRYNAACSAALAGFGEGKDADQADDKERVRLRRQALDWLRADLAAYRQMLEKEPDKARPLVVGRMAHWQQDTDLAGVRSTEALAKFPEAERAEWTKLWQDVAALGKQAAEGKRTHQELVAEPELVPLPKEVPAK